MFQLSNSVFYIKCTNAFIKVFKLECLLILEFILYSYSPQSEAILHFFHLFLSFPPLYFLEIVITIILDFSLSKLNI